MKLRVEGPLTGQSRVCEPILRALPDWFGLEASTQAYITQTDLLPTFVAVTEEAPGGVATPPGAFPMIACGNDRAVLIVDDA